MKISIPRRRLPRRRRGEQAYGCGALSTLAFLLAAERRHQPMAINALTA